MNTPEQMQIWNELMIEEHPQRAGPVEVRAPWPSLDQFRDSVGILGRNFLLHAVYLPYTLFYLGIIHQLRMQAGSIGGLSGGGKSMLPQSKRQSA